MTKCVYPNIFELNLETKYFLVSWYRWYVMEVSCSTVYSITSMYNAQST